LKIGESVKILITGNMGYVGPGVVRRLRQSHPEAVLIGFDMGYFGSCLTAETIPECRLDAQYFGDVRNFPRELLSDAEAIVHLAAISNDPMGNTFEQVTHDVNYFATVRLAAMAKEAGVRSFVFPSSCSVYGFFDGKVKTEESSVEPLTAYARSKVMAERDLTSLADRNFTVTCLRFATACGMSDRLRLDLVLNDFVASAVACQRIVVLSDGTPWRPLIHVTDMARALDWGVIREPSAGGDSLVVNAGSDRWNYQVKDLAQAVSGIIPKVDVSINKDAQPDKRSYRVSFQLFASLAPDYQPEVVLTQAVTDLKEGLEMMDFKDRDFRNSLLVRLTALKNLQTKGLLTDALEWRERGARDDGKKENYSTDQANQA
jgi:nucleoside-diphosphate-sugar epimerase